MAYEYLDGIGDTVETGTEDLTKASKLTITGNDPALKKSEATKLYVRTVDNKNFRVYMCGINKLDSPYFQNRFCLFMDGLKADQTVTLELGSDLSGNGHVPNIQLGMMISSIRNCKAHTTTLAAGRCSFAESCMFVYGKECIISPYGAIQFTGIKAYEKIVTPFTVYFTQILKDAVSKDILTEEHFTILSTTGKSIMRTHTGVYVP